MYIKVKFKQKQSKLWVSQSNIFRVSSTHMYKTCTHYTLCCFLLKNESITYGFIDIPNPNISRIFILFFYKFNHAKSNTFQVNYMRITCLGYSIIKLNIHFLTFLHFCTFVESSQTIPVSFFQWDEWTANSSQ